MTTKRILFVFILGISLLANSAIAQRYRYTISGYVHERGSGEALGGIRVLAVRADKNIPQTTIEEKSFVTTSNNYGFYSLTLKNYPGGWNLYIRVTGFNDDSMHWSGIKDTSVNFELTSKVDIELMDEVKIIAKRNTIADKTEMSTVDVPVSQIKDIPALLGEKDVLKVIQLLPGVQKGGEGQSGIYVRGGGPDQNLLILDEAMVYNASHLFGFFSVFNGDALKSVELIKGGFPAKYGGRLSSVIDLTMKEGNKERITGEVGVGLIAGRFMVEGPLKKKKSSFMISGRRTYLDLLAAPIIMAANNGGMAGYYFYDMNMKLNYTLSNKDKLYLSGYFGRDNFYADFQDRWNSKISTSYGWGNRTLTGRWNHQFTPKLFSNLSLIHSHYDLSILVTLTVINQSSYLRYSSSINDYGAKYDFDYRPLPNHNVRFGASSILHYFAPSALLLKENNKEIFDKSVNETKSLESGIYVEDYIKIDKFGIFPGLRISHYFVDGKQLFNPEPRISMSYNQSKSLAYKASFASMNQYVMLLSNSRSSLPTDLWIPATQNIKPISSQQVALGVAKDFSNGLNFSVEAYYKTMQNVELLKDGESALDFGAFDPKQSQNARNWEKKLTAGKAWSKGVEFFLQKKTGKLSGWIGYTLSFTQMQFDEINEGKPFWAKYDRRHDISVVAIYKITKELSFAATWVYGTGNAVNIERGYINTSSYTFTQNPYLWNPIFQTAGLNRNIDYGARNSFRMEPYHRLDVALKLSKERRHGIQTWEFGAYNAYNRANPFFYYGSQNDFGAITLKKVSIFPLIPSVSWSYKFN